MTKTFSVKTTPEMRDENKKRFLLKTSSIKVLARTLSGQKLSSPYEEPHSKILKETNELIQIFTAKMSFISKLRFRSNSTSGIVKPPPSAPQQKTNLPKKT